MNKRTISGKPLNNEYDGNGDKEIEKHVEHLTLAKLVQSTTLFPAACLHVHPSVKKPAKIRTNKVKQ